MKEFSIVFKIDYGPSKVFDKIPSDHEWVGLCVGSIVEIYHSSEKWEGVYNVAEVESWSEKNITYRLRLKSVRLKCVTGGHNKEWLAKVTEGTRGQNTTVKCEWGKIGGTLQSKDFAFNSISQALKFVHEKIEEKLKKGYTK